jgi:hypothetical protein
MKTLKIACFLMGMIAIVKLVYTYTIIPAATVQQPQDLNITLTIVNLAVALVSAAISFLLAKKLNRSAFGWGIFSFFLPFFSCFILPFLKWKETTYRPATSYNSSSYGNSSWGSGYYSDKTCSSCHKSVPTSSRAGQYCPHCGVYWSTETTKR